MLLEWKYWISWSVADPAPPARPARISNSSSQIADVEGPSLDRLLALDLFNLVVVSYVTELGPYDQSSATMKGAGDFPFKWGLGP